MSVSIKMCLYKIYNPERVYCIEMRGLSWIKSSEHGLQSSVWGFQIDTRESLEIENIEELMVSAFFFTERNAVTVDD
jgi:hypothetical protein